MAFFQFAHILWERTKPTIVLTQQIRDTFFPDKGNSASTLECIWLCVAIYLQNSTQCWFSQHCDWFSLQTKTQSHAEDTSQNPGRHPNNTYRGDHLFLGCRWWRTILLHKSRQLRRVRRTNPWAEKTIQKKCEAMDSKQWTILLENKCERVHKDRRKHYVVFHEQNQGKCTNTSIARCRFYVEEYATENPRPSIWWSVNDDRHTVLKLPSKWRQHNSERWPTVQQ